MVKEMTKRIDYEKLTLDEFQDECFKTAVYKESIEELIKPIVNFIENSNSQVHIKGEAYITIYKIEKILNFCYLVLGLIGECGEISNKMKKVIRDDKDIMELIPEVNDATWYTNTILNDCGIPASKGASMLLDKLGNRLINNTIKGDGDDRQ